MQKGIFNKINKINKINKRKGEPIMWTRKELKTNAKSLLKANYWKAFFASLITALFTAGSSSSSGQNASDEAQQVMVTYDGVDASTVLATIGLILGACAVIFLVSLLFSIFVSGPFRVGAQKLLLNCKEGTAKCGDVLFAFKNSYLNVAKTMFLQGLYIVLWSLLLVVPGIVKAYEYRMVIYLIAENPGMSSGEAFARSKEMMKGQKWNAFVLDLSFIGWHILGVCTLGILETFYVMPYALLTNAELYHALKTEN